MESEIKSTYLFFKSLPPAFATLQMTAAANFVKMLGVPCPQHSLLITRRFLRPIETFHFCAGPTLRDIGHRACNIRTFFVCL